MVTGIGTVNPLGLDLPSTWKNLIDGVSGISKIDEPYTGVKVAGIVRDFDPKVALSLEADPKYACTPFDQRRSGFVMGEGASVYILETLKHARERGANIYARVSGYADTSDGFKDTEPSGVGAARGMRIATLYSRPDGYRYINAHGTGTSVGDEAEALEIRYGIPDLSRTYVSSTKGQSGHLLGGAGALEAIFCIKALNEGLVPAIINLKNPIPEAEGINLVAGEAQPVRDLTSAVNNSFGFGGINGVLEFERFEG